MAHQHDDAVAKAKELGATGFREGINWNWCSNFPTEEAADEFVEWLDSKGYEHRGVYPPDKGTLWSVRYRSDSDIVW